MGKLGEQEDSVAARYLEKFNFLNTSAVTQKQLESGDILGEERERSLSQELPTTRGADRSGPVSSLQFPPVTSYLYRCTASIRCRPPPLSPHPRTVPRARCRRL